MLQCISHKTVNALEYVVHTLETYDNNEKRPRIFASPRDQTQETEHDQDDQQENHEDHQHAQKI